MPGESDGYPQTIDERLPDDPSREDVLDAAEGFAFELFVAHCSTPTLPTATDAARVLRDRLLARIAIEDRSDTIAATIDA